MSDQNMKPYDICDDILKITPADQDPIVYWYNVARDSIRSADTAAKRCDQLRSERNEAKHDYAILTDKLVSAAHQHRDTPVDLSGLIHLVESGNLDVNISIYLHQKEDLNHDQ